MSWLSFIFLSAPSWFQSGPLVSNGVDASSVATVASFCKDSSGRPIDSCPYFMARATGFFLNLKQDDIEAIVASAVAQLQAGKVMMSYSDSGTTVSKQWPMTIQQVLIEARYALQVKDPAQYGAIDRVRVYNGLWNFRGL